MLVDLFKRFRFSPIENYQYVGFGSVAFVDHRMMHRALGITSLISIEDTDDEFDQTRFEHNKPYRGIRLRWGSASTVLPELNFSRPSLVWLDYDVGLRRSMASDMATVVRNLPSGSFIGLTVAVSFPAERSAAASQVEHLKGNFSEFLNDDAAARDFQGPAYGEFARTVLGNLLARSLNDFQVGVMDPTQRRSLKQICNFRYKDGKAQMATFGWIVVSAEDLPRFDECAFEALPFVRTGATPFSITVPHVTPLEVREMERRLPDLLGTAELDWIPQTDRQAFADSYRYLPSFAPIEQI